MPKQTAQKLDLVPGRTQTIFCPRLRTNAFADNTFRFVPADDAFSWAQNVVLQNADDVQKERKYSTETIISCPTFTAT